MNSSADDKEGGTHWTNVVASHLSYCVSLKTQLDLFIRPWVL